MSAVGENRLQLSETLPGLLSAGEAFQVVQVSGRTEDKENKHKSCPESVCFSQNQEVKCETSPGVCVAEVRPEFGHTAHVNTLRSAVDKLTPSAMMTQEENGDLRNHKDFLTELFCLKNHLLPDGIICCFPVGH